VRILILSQYFWPEGFRINDLALGLKERGHEVAVLTGMPNCPSGRFFRGYGFLTPSAESFQGIRIYRVPLLPRGTGQTWRLALNYLSFALFASLLGPLRCREAFDIIFVYEPSPVTVGVPALVLKALRGAPIMFWVQDLWPETLSATGAVRRRWILNAVERFVRFLYANCDRILVQSQAFLPSIQKLGGRADRILYLPNSAEAFYRPMALEVDAPERQGVPDGFRVMFAGTIGAAQDFETILAAMERLRSAPDIRLLIVGDGRMRGWVEGEVRRRGLSATVHLLGSRPAEAMPRLFALADALLVTLKKDPIFALTIPSKVQSYLACARPIIAGLDGEGARIVEEAGAGLTCGAEDPDALAAAILTMYQTPEARRSAMGANGRVYYDAHFERSLVLDRLIGWMHDMKSEAVTCVS